MVATTPKNYPYPVGTDRVMDGDDAIHNLAIAIDYNVANMAGGTVIASVPANAYIGYAAVTFPAWQVHGAACSRWLYLLYVHHLGL